jgi:hypothetical protein
VLDRYGLVLLLLILTIVVIAVAGDRRWGPALTLVTLAATTFAALRASDVQRRLLRLAVALIPIVALVGIAATLVGDSDATKAVAASLTILLVAVTPPAIARRFARHPVINLQTFYAAVCVYLLLAMLFATAFRLVALVSGHPFFVQTSGASTFEYLYFSFVTMTTTGYGDFTAAGDVGRTLAVLEAILGQLYLVTVVALVVNNLSRQRSVKFDQAQGKEPEER